MLCHPALGLALIGSNTQCKALFAQEYVPAVTGIHRDNGVILREVADIALLFINVALAVQAAHPVVAVAENFPNLLTYAGHDAHVHDNINGVGQLYADLRKRRANRAHGIRDHVHCAALIAVLRNVEQHLISGLRLHPVVGGACVFFLAGADISSAFYTSHVVHSGAMQIAARQLFLVELNHLARGASFRAQLVELFLRAVNPHNIVRIDKLFHVFNPIQDGFIFCHKCSPSGPWPNHVTDLSIVHRLKNIN